MELVTAEYIDILIPSAKGSICLNVRQAALVIGVHQNTLRKWAKENVSGPEYIKIDNGKRGRVLYPKKAIALWMNSKLVKTL